MIEFKMPALGADMEAGTLVSWLVEPGETVSRGQIIAEVETHKGIIEIECWNDGTLQEILVQPGVEVPVGQSLALIATSSDEGEHENVGKEATKATDTMARNSSPSVSMPSHHMGPSQKKHFRVSPLARKLAKEKNLDLSIIQGSGPGGAITRSDVLRFEETEKQKESKPSQADQQRKKSAAMRHAIALAMSRSKREIPHYYLQTETNVQKTMEWLDKQNQDKSVGDRVLAAALYIKAVAMAAKKVPEMNGFWIDDCFHPSKSVHVGMGIALRYGGLVAPAIHHVEDKTVPEIMKNLVDLVSRARAGKLRSSEMTDATITVTSLGEQGVETVFGVIYPPQVAIVGFGKVTHRPWAEGAMLGVSPTVVTTLSGDHRASDGHRGGIFLNHIKQYLTNFSEYQ